MRTWLLRKVLEISASTYRAMQECTQAFRPGTGPNRATYHRGNIMKNEVHDYCGELHSLMQGHAYSLTAVREDPADYFAESLKDLPREPDTQYICHEAAYRQLHDLHAELRLLHALNTPRTQADAASSLRLSRAALADWLDRMASRQQAVLDGLRPRDA